jgi:hypothetical protein
MHPVLFTSDKKDARQSTEDMRVIWQPSIKGPGSVSTEIWWDCVGRLDFPDGGVVMVDHLAGHFSKTLEQEMRDLDVTLLHYPKYSGAILDPCDNSWFADLKHRYYAKDRSTHGLMIQAIRESVYETDTETLKHYWQHCGYTSNLDSEMVINCLSGEGFEINSLYNTEFDVMKKKYQLWKKRWRNHHPGASLKDAATTSRKRTSKYV